MDILILIISLFLLYNGKLAWVLFSLIVLTTQYLGAGTFTSEFPFPHNVYDSGLILYFALSVYLLSKNNFKLPKTPFNKYLKYFYIFLLISFVVDIIFNGIDLLSIIKTSRHWIFLTCIWIFYYIPGKEVKKLINYLLYALVIVSVIILVQFFFEIRILAQEHTEYLTPGFLIERGLLPAGIIMFFLFLLFTKYYKFKPAVKYLFIAIFTAVLIASLVRSWLFAAVTGVILIFYLQKKLKFKSLFAGIIIIAGLILIIYINPISKERFTQGIEDVQGFSLTSNAQGNFSFRILQTAERVNYISQSLQYVIFGIGNITEENFPNVFYIGLRFESGRILQLTTPDIAWQVLFIRLGFLGTLIYLVFFTKILTTFYRLKSTNPIALTAFIYLFINLVIISFVSWDIANGWFLLFPVLLYFFVTGDEKMISDTEKKI